jgi:hypothetical protein
MGHTSPFESAHGVQVHTMRLDVSFQYDVMKWLAGHEGHSLHVSLNVRPLHGDACS